MNTVERNAELLTALSDLLHFTEQLYIHGSIDYFDRCPAIKNAQRLIAKPVTHVEQPSAKRLVQLLTFEQRQHLIEMLKMNQTDLQGQNDEAHDLYSSAISLVIGT